MGKKLKPTRFEKDVGLQLYAGSDVLEVDSSVLFYVTRHYDATKQFAEFVIWEYTFDKLFPQFVFEYRSSVDGRVQMKKVVSNLVYSEFVDELKKVTTKWQRTYIRRGGSDYSEWVFSKDLRVRSHLSGSAPENIDELYDLLKKYFSVEAV